MKVAYYQRKPRTGFNFSIEGIFDDVRERLKDCVEAKVILSPKYNDGYYSKLVNVWNAHRRESKHINHITGEVHFLNLMMAKSRVVLTVHDCSMVNRKKGLAREVVKWLYLIAPVWKARTVTAVSEATKRDIIRHTGCSADKIRVIPVAVDPIYQPSPQPFNRECPTILHIGTGYNKNLSRLAQALTGLECRLTIIGKLSDGQKEELRTNGICYDNKYGISQSEMYRQYVECDLLCFISTFEGFGMPIVEANAVERPVITGNVSSMPEIAGDAACQVDPYDVSEMRRGIQRVINDADYREQLIRNGRRNKLRFDADTIARSYYDLYHEMQISADTKS